MAAEIAQAHQKQLTRIQKNIENAHQYFKYNIDNFNKFRKMVFQTALTRDEIADLSTLGKPPLQFNVLEAYISRLKGEFSKQTPSPLIHSQKSGEIEILTIKVLEAHFRAILDDANQKGFSDAVYNETLSGGFSVMKVWTEYENPMSFNQTICLGKVYDPTLCGFDPLARLPSKSDAEFCYELSPMTKEQFEKEYPHIKTKHLSFTRQSAGFNWSYRQGDQDVLLIADYYEKKKKKSKILYLSNGQSMTRKDYDKLLETFTDQIVEPPQIANERTTEFESIVRYRFIDDILLEFLETDFESLPLIFVDGNSAIINENDNTDNTIENSRQMTRPYVYHAMDMQKLKNFAGQTLAAELENLVMHKFIVEEAAIPDKYLEAWINPQVPGSLVWQSTDKDGRELPRPEAVPRVPVPPEVFGTFESAEKTIQNILGSYDAALGINKNQLSGIAIVEGATQSNNTAMPYVMNYLTSLTQAFQVLLELIPKYYVTSQTIPIMNEEGQREYITINDEENPQSLSLKLDPNVLGVQVKAGVNFEVQKNRSLQTIVQLMQGSEGFKAMIEQRGLSILVDNLDIRGQEELKGMARDFMKQMEQQRQQAQQAAASGTQNNPQTLLVKNEIEKTALQVQKQRATEAYNAAKIENDRQKLELEKFKTQIDVLEKREDHLVQLTRANTEREDKAAQIAMKRMEQEKVELKEFFKLIQPK